MKRNHPMFKRGILAGLLLLALPLMAPSAKASTQELDRVVAVVNDGVIVESELAGELKRVAIEFRRRGEQPPPVEQLGRQVLERLINKRLQLEAAARANIQLSEETLTEAVASIAQENKMSLAEMRKVLEKEGLSFDQFRSDLRERLLIQRLREQEINRRIKVSDREIESWIQQNAKAGAGGRSAYHLLHILVAVREGATAAQISQARAKAEKIVAELRGGADFRATARAVSEGQQALEGGDLGWREAGQVPDRFVEVLAKMEKGAISDPILTASGFNIIKMEDYKGGSARVVTQTHARHILIRTSEVVSDHDANTRLEQLRQRILGGADFAELARSHSDDQAAALRGGDLGWITGGDVVPEFEKAMNALAPNEISKPFRTEFGWHIVQVLERRQHDSTGETEKAEARAAIRKKKSEEETELYVRRLRDEAYVEILIGKP